MGTFQDPKKPEQVELEVDRHEVESGLKEHGLGGFGQRLLQRAALRSSGSEVVSYTGRLEEAQREIPWLVDCESTFHKVIPPSSVAGQEQYLPSFRPIAEKTGEWEFRLHNPHFGEYLLQVSEDSARLRLSQLTTQFRSPRGEHTDRIYSYYLERANQAIQDIAARYEHGLVTDVRISRIPGPDEPLAPPAIVTFEFQNLPTSKQAVELLVELQAAHPLNHLDNGEAEMCAEGARNPALVKSFQTFLAENLARIPAEATLRLPL